MSSDWHKYSVEIGVDRNLAADLLVAPDESDSGIAVVMHTLGPKKLGAPMHRHTREDEMSYILDGELAVKEGDDVTTVETGEIAVKERDVWHTFWNPGTEPVRFLEIIAPGEFAGYFEELDALLAADERRDEETLRRIRELGEAYGFESDPESVPELIEEHDLER